MLTSDLREMTISELQEEIKKLKSELFKLRFQNFTRQLKNTERLGMVKKDIARVYTVISEKLLQNERA